MGSRGGVSKGMSTSMEETRILVVEDEADIQQVLCFYLEHFGFIVRSASNGQEAISLIAEFSPHLILLDMMMQPVSGWEVLHWLREKQLTPPLPVLVHTALVDLKEQLRGLEEGATDYIPKPTQPRAIVEQIRTLLSLSAEQRLVFQRQHLDEYRRLVEYVHAPQTDEFVY